MKRFLLVLAPLILLACREGRMAAPSAEDGYVTLDETERRAAPSRFARTARPDLSGAGLAVNVTKVTELPPIRPSDLTTMVIRNGTATIQVDTLERAVAAVQAIAARAGGYVAGTDVATGREQVHTATLELKVPAARFDDALAGLRSIGKLERVEVTAEDVGEEFVDVTARMDNARRLEQRLVTLLASRTGKLSDVLAVERELARVREEIERYEGRLRYLRAHAAVSTLAVTVHQPYPVVGTAGTSVVGGAFLQAWRNFVAVVAVLIQSLGVVVPLGVLAILGWLGVRTYGRTRRMAV